MAMERDTMKVFDRFHSAINIMRGPPEILRGGRLFASATFGCVKSRAILGSVCWLVCCLAVAEKPKDLKPEFAFIGAESGDAVLAMTCTGSASYSTIQCQFLRLDISKKTPDDVKKSVKEVREAVSKMSEQQVKARFQDACQSVKAAAGTTLPGRAASGTRISATRALDGMKSLCACTSKECLERWVVASAEAEGRNCEVSTQQFTATFKRAGRDKWISTHGPEGICDLVTVQVIERESDHPNLWTFSQTTPYRRHQDPLCQGFQLNQPDRFSSWYPKVSALSCDEIEFTQWTRPVE